MHFSIVYTSPSTQKILQHLDDGRVRYVSQDYQQYLDWINAGNIPKITRFVPPVPCDPWDSVREQRNLRLKESDWTDLPHAPLTDKQKEAWIVYRQALRDITKQLVNPSEVVWPILSEI